MFTKRGTQSRHFISGRYLKISKGPESVSALELTNTTQYIKDFTTAHIEFQTIYDEKIIHDASESSSVITELKNDLIYYVSSLLSYIDLSTDLDIGPFKPVNSELNVILANTMATLRASQKRLANEINGTIATTDKMTEVTG